MKDLFKLLCVGLVLGAGYRYWSQREPRGFQSGDGAKAQLQQALSTAQRENKRVLLEVGSETCPWCARMNRFLAEDEGVRAAAQKAFVVVRLDYRGNQELIGGYPPINGTPYFYVLEKDGVLLSPQDTDAFESGDTYDREKLLAFFRAWAPPS